MPIWSPGRHIPTQKIPKCPPGGEPFLEPSWSSWFTNENKRLRSTVYLTRKKRNSQSPSAWFGPRSFAENIMVSIIFIWEISQELSEPYQSAVTKVITCKDAVGAFFIHPPAFEWNLATSSIRPVWSLLDFSFLLLLESTSKNKKLREKGTCNTVLWNFIPIFSWLR